MELSTAPPGLLIYVRVKVLSCRCTTGACLFNTRMCQNSSCETNRVLELKFYQYEKQVCANIIAIYLRESLLILQTAHVG